MLNLQLFGGARVFDERGVALESTATRRTLAILAALSIAGDAGVSRDKLIALLWPETDTERARHSLTQALYAAKRGLKCEDLFLGGADLRLNSAVITSDVVEFERAMADGNREDAAMMYRGGFLDGFFLSGAPEFERWVSAQRSRLDGKYAEALEHLANDAEARADHRRALEFWRRLADLRPLDSRVALRLMQSLAATGDRASALQFAQLHGTLLREELGISPDSSIANFTRRLRLTDTTVAPDLARRPAVGVVQTGLTPVDDTHRRMSVASPGYRRPVRSRLALAIVVAGTLVGAGFALARRTGGGGEPEMQPLSPSHRVVVAPFRVAGIAPELRYLREGIVELLSARLVDDSAAQSVDVGAILGAWRAAGLVARTEVAREDMVRVATRLGAERVVVGSIVGAPTRLVIGATVLRAPGGAVLAQATVEGPLDSLTAVVDRLAARLLLAQAGEDSAVIGHVTWSLPALRAYLAGQAAFQRRGYRAAIVAYDRALQRDSAFARAALRLAWAGDRISDAGATHRGLALAWAARDNLSDRDAALMRSFTGPRYPLLSTANEQVLAWRGPVDIAPRTAIAWLALGTRLLRDAAVVGLTSSDDRARVALERASTLDRNSFLPFELMALLAFRESPRLELDSAVRARALGDSLSPIAAYLRWRDAVARRDTIELQRTRARFGQLRVSTLRLIAMASQYDSVEIADGERAVEILLDRATDEASRGDALEALHSFFLNRGRTREALDVTTQLRQLQPGAHAYLRLRVLDGLYGGGDRAAALAAAGQLAKFTSTGLAGTPVTAASWMADRCVLALWRLHAADTTGVQQTIADLRMQQVKSERPQISAAPDACAELLAAAFAVIMRRPDAAAQLARTESLAFTSHTAGDAVAYGPLLLANLHERLGDTAGALRALQKRAYMSGWPRYQASMQRAQSRLLDTTRPGGAFHSP